MQGMQLNRRYVFQGPPTSTIPTRRGSIACARAAQPNSPQLVGPKNSQNPQQNKELPTNQAPKLCTYVKTHKKNHTHNITDHNRSPQLHRAAVPDKQDQCTTTTHANRTIPTNMSHQKPDSASLRCTYSQMPVKQDQHIRQVPCPAKRGSLPAPGEPSPNHLNWLDPQRTRTPNKTKNHPPG